jgi:hypothetical protein
MKGTEPARPAGHALEHRSRSGTRDPPRTEGTEPSPPNEPEYRKSALAVEPFAIADHRAAELLGRGSRSAPPDRSRSPCDRVRRCPTGRRPRSSVPRRRSRRPAQRLRTRARQHRRAGDTAARRRAPRRRLRSHELAISVCTRAATTRTCSAAASAGSHADRADPRGSVTARPSLRESLVIPFVIPLAIPRAIAVRKIVDASDGRRLRCEIFAASRRRHGIRRYHSAMTAKSAVVVQPRRSLNLDQGES